MTADPADLPSSLAAELARSYAPYHSLVYFAPEVRLFTEAGLQGWWMAYFVYRSAPLGVVPVELVIATFYNFAPRMVRRALPAGWQILSPARALDLRLEVVDRAFRRLLGDAIRSPELAEAAHLARRAIEGCDLAGRPLYAAEAARPWPDEPHLMLWQACTLLREHRGDGHISALASAGLDGVASHVVLVARGHGNRASILPIRGWTAEEWAAAEQRLVERGWLNPDGSFTPEGRAGREAVEQLTNQLAFEPVRRLGADGVRRLGDLMRPFSRILLEQGKVPRDWPPPHLLRPEPA